MRCFCGSVIFVKAGLCYGGLLGTKACDLSIRVSDLQKFIFLQIVCKEALLKSRDKDTVFSDSPSSWNSR